MRASLHEGAGEKGALLLAAGQLADLAVGEILHADLLEGVHGSRAFTLSGSADPAEAAVEAHGDDVEDGGGKVPSRRCRAAARSRRGCGPVRRAGRRIVRCRRRGV